MTSRERVQAAITFDEPDRVPLDVWPVPASFKRHGERLAALFEEHPIDFVHPNWIMKWDPESLEPTFREGKYTDEWGVVWQCLKEGYSGMDVGHPLADWSALDSIQVPEHEWLTVSYKDACKGEGKFDLGVGAVLWHRMCFLRGMEALMMDLVDDVPEVYRLRDIVADFYAAQIEALTKTDVDGIILFDDWGGQRQLLIPPGIWRAFFKPVYRRFFEICKGAGKYIFFHSDGYIVDIIEDFIELGVDALNSQVWCMGPKMLGERFGGRITFWGEINRQSTMPDGTPDDVRREAAVMREHLSTPAGGLIGQGEIDGLTPIENIEALMTAWNE